MRLFGSFKQGVIFRRSDDDGLFHCFCAERSWKDPKTLSKHVKMCPSVFQAIIDGLLEIDEKDPSMLKIFLDAVKEKVNPERIRTSTVSTEEISSRVSSISPNITPEDIPCGHSEDGNSWDSELWNPKQMKFTSLFPDYEEVSVPLPLLNKGFYLHSVLEGTIIVCLECKTILDVEMLIAHIETEHPKLEAQYPAFCKVFSATRFLGLDEVFNYVDDLNKSGLPFPAIPGFDIIKDCYYYENEIFKTKNEFADRVRNQNIGLIAALMRANKVDVQVLTIGVFSILALVDLDVMTCLLH